MRLWNRTREGRKRDRGVDTDDGVDRREVSRIGSGDPGDEGGWLFAATGLDRNDVFLRRTGPGPEEGKSSVGRRERSAMSHGLRSSGAASSVDIHGRSSNACDGGGGTRGAKRRRRMECEVAFDRRRELGT